MEVVNIIKQIIVPPNSIVLAVLITSIFLKKNKFIIRVNVVLAVLLYLFSTNLFSSWFLSSLEVYPPLSPVAELPAGPQAIVILSAEMRMATEYPNPSPGPLTLARVRYGAFLQRRTGLPILVSGGVIPEAGSLAAAMQRSLADDFRASARWVEDRSTDTHENALRSAEILRPEGIREIYLVTHAWHMARAKLAFEQAGFKVTPAPTDFAGDEMRRNLQFNEKVDLLLPSTKALQNSYYAFHEIIGIVFYRLLK